MKLAVAQMRPIVGAIEGNIDLHLALVNLGVRNGASLIVFPELSLTGYEPFLAAELSRFRHDSCLALFQPLCDANNVSIGVGLPLRTSTLPHISTLLFRPHARPLVYSKRYLHADEEAFFGCGTELDCTIYDDPRVGLAICYELSIPEHASNAFATGATAYIASVAKTARGVEEASRRMSDLANRYSAITMLSNCIGTLDSTDCVGRSSAWGRNGTLLARLDSDSDGVIVVDYDTEEAVTEVLTPMG